MQQKYEYDAVVIGSGPNGLSAGITLARQSLSVLILEAKDTAGGGLRTAEITLHGFLHDICSAVHPLAVGSPFFNKLPLSKHGLEWIYPEIFLAHPFDDGKAAVLKRSIEQTADSMEMDSGNYKRIMFPLSLNWNELSPDFLGPLTIPRNIPAALKFGLYAVQSARNFWEHRFQGVKARSIFAGAAAHGFVPLNQIFTAAIGLVLLISGHTNGWAIPKGGSVSIASALLSYYRELGGEIKTGIEVKSIDELPHAKTYVFDVTPRQLLKIAGNQFSQSYIKKLNRFRYGPGVFKIDYALKEPVPFKAKECMKSAVVHLGGSHDEIFESEYLIHHKKYSAKPFVLLAQQSLFDNSRAPEKKHTLWAYCHVPHGSKHNFTDNIEKQIERFAPGFREIILDKNIMYPSDFESYNPNYIGGDINGGLQDAAQLFTRPVVSLNPYRTSKEGIYICSSSTPPGGGVHGMCGFHSARSVLNDIFKVKIPRR